MFAGIVGFRSADLFLETMIRRKFDVPLSNNPRKKSGLCFFWPVWRHSAVNRRS